MQKSCLFVVGKAHTATIDCLKMGPDTVSWRNELKYLGVYFNSGRTLLIDTEISVSVSLFWEDNSVVFNGNVLLTAIKLVL